MTKMNCHSEQEFEVDIGADSDEMEDLKDQLKQAQVGYNAAIDALPYMPEQARPHTQKTANDYSDKIARITERMKEIG